MKMLYALILITISTILVWFNQNIRYYSEWWDEHYLLNIALFAPVIGFFTYIYWGVCMEVFGSMWSARLVSYAVSTIIFSIITWYFANENPFELKTIICILLSLVILLVQMYL